MEKQCKVCGLVTEHHPLGFCIPCGNAAREWEFKRVALRAEIRRQQRTLAEEKRRDKSLQTLARKAGINSPSPEQVDALLAKVEWQRKKSAFSRRK